MFGMWKILRYNTAGKTKFETVHTVVALGKRACIEECISVVYMHIDKTEKKGSGNFKHLLLENNKTKEKKTILGSFLKDKLYLHVETYIS